VVSRFIRDPELADEKQTQPAPYLFRGKRSKGRRYNTGLYSRQRGVHLRDLKVAALVRRMRRAAPWLCDSDVPVCQTWARLEILICIGYTALTQGNAYFDKKTGEARRLRQDVRRLIDSQLNFSRELGLTPASITSIRANSTNAAVDVALQCAVDRQAEEARAPSDVDADTTDGHDLEVT
jgi:hypothetical protein